MLGQGQELTRGRTMCPNLSHTTPDPVPRSSPSGSLELVLYKRMAATEGVAVCPGTPKAPRAPPKGHNQAPSTPRRGHT